MTTHSSTFAWKIPWTEKLRRLQSMGLQRVRHDWATSLHFQWWVYQGHYAKWNKRSLVGYSPWGHKELNMTEWLSIYTEGQILHVSVYIKKSKIVKLIGKVKWWLPGAGRRGKWRVVKQVWSFSYARWVSSRYLLYNLVPVVNTSYHTLKNLLRGSISC